MKKKIFSILFAFILIFAIKNTCNAANASITCDSSATVGENINITVTGSAVQWNLELKVNGESIAKNSEVDNIEGNKNISFSGTYTPTSEGTLNVTLAGTVTEASDGSTVRNFESKTITVKAKEAESNNNDTNNSSSDNTATTTKSSEARLKNLGIQPNDFKGFTKNTYEYTVEVPSTLTEVRVYAKPYGDNAKVTSGTGKVALKEDTTQVKVVCTAEDGKTTKTYTLNIVKKAVEDESTSEARLSNLGINPKEYDFSGFKRDTLEYTVEVPNDLEEVEVYAESVSSKAKVSGIGTIKLNEGENVAKVEVTAEDGTKKIYTLTIIRKELEGSITGNENDDETGEKKLGLKSLEIAGLTLKPKFDTETYEYSVDLTEDLNSLDLKAISNLTGATVEIAGNEDLKQGENTITILVTDKENSDTTTYQIMVNKNVSAEEVVKASWLKPSTWGKENKIIAAIVIVLILLIILVIVMKIKLLREDDEEERLELPGGDELDRALSEHQELSEEDDEYDSEENIAKPKKEKSDIEIAQEYFEEYSRKRGKHF